MPHLHETMLGRTLLEGHIPRAIETLKSIDSSLKERNEIAIRANSIAIEANELKKRELDLLEKYYKSMETAEYEHEEIINFGKETEMD